MAISRLLVLSYYVGVEASSYSSHVDERLEEFSRRGIEFEVISSICGKRQQRYRHHRVMSLFFADQVREIRAVLKRTERRRWAKRAALLGLKAVLYPLYLLDRKLVPLTPAWSWYVGASLLGLYRCLACRPQILYAVSGPDSVHLVGVTIARCLGIPLVSEFTDPLVQQINPRKKAWRRFAAWAEKTTIRRAHRVIYVTQTAARAARQCHAAWADKITAIYPYAAKVGIPEDIAGKAAPAGRRVIAHFGSLSRNRNLDAFLSAAETCRNADGWEVHLYGRLNSAAKSALELSHAERKAPMVRVLGTIPRSEAVKRMYSVDVLLLVQHATAMSTRTIPGKTYEYMQTEKLILAFTRNNPELMELLQRHGHLAADLDDRDQCVRITRQVFDDWERLATGVQVLAGDLAQSVDDLLREMEAACA